VKNNNYSLARV